MGAALLISVLLLAPQAPFVTAAEATRLLSAHATVLDARTSSDYAAGHLPGATRIDWQDFRDGWGRTGLVDPDDATLARKLGALGVDDARPVLIYGAARGGWGEEGRIGWMLSYLGHAHVHILDGGFAAWTRAALDVERDQSRVSVGHFTPRRRVGERAELTDVARADRDGSSLLIDTRTDAEWNGATPYFEARGGHIPSARHLAWTDLLDARGELRPAAELEQRLSAVGARHDRPVILYCTGGVRSAFAWAVLRSLGYRDVRNFDGSFWLWAQHRELPVVTPTR